ncbi:MAG TPA: glycine--tRNA ligase subunit beta [Terriglobia bacterium]|nr:glycine--tRNA ligase subunit beta [Terriglobia bacterium]
MNDETRNSKLATGNREAETRNSKTETGNPAVEERQSPIDNRQSSMPLLLEVGCEEIPARFLRDAEKGLGERVQAVLRQARLLFPADAEAGVGAVREPPLQTYSTPRRLVVHVPALLAQQPNKVEEILGPPVRVAIDREGNYTRAAESFAKKNSARLEELTRTTTPKGEYLSLSKTTQGRPALEILPEILPGAILGLTFPKSMYWTEKLAPRFVRPIRWIVALLGEGEDAATVEFKILGVKTGNFTFGHRAKSRQALTVNGFKDYSKKLSQNIVDIDYNRRRERIIQEAQAVVAEAGGKIIQDDWLTDWIANSTEWPRPMLGSFDERFLHLPREILITVMRDHQRYFAVEDGQGNLRPHFVAVLNMDSDEKGLIRQGHQRVLTARFRDAEFFWNADQKVPLRHRVLLLDKVTYQAKLGSYGDKVRRMKSIAGNACVSLEDSGMMTPSQTLEVLRTVELSKCDLTTQMVQEFTELQGVVGGLYAKAQGEPEKIAVAIYDHYLPLGAEGASPRTLLGAMVSLADKMDSVVAGFAAGNEPTGSSDPFAIRRQANGIIKVILENQFPLSLKESINKATDALDIEWRKPREEIRSRVLDFFAERLLYYFESVRGFRYDTVRAVVAAGADEPADAQARAEAMEALRGGEDFEALSAAAKRIRNILAKSATAADWEAGDVAPELLNEPQEKDLHEAYGRIAGDVERRRAGRDYRGALEEISTLRPVVDRFFDKVLVMAEDRELRQNRLRLLKKLDDLFSGIAHLSEIVVGAANAQE